MSNYEDLMRIYGSKQEPKLEKEYIIDQIIEVSSIVFGIKGASSLKTQIVKVYPDGSLRVRAFGSKAEANVHPSQIRM